MPFEIFLLTDRYLSDALHNFSRAESELLAVARWVVIGLTTMTAFIITSDQSDESDLLNFVQNQLHMKSFAFRIESRSARMRLRKI